MTDTATSQPRAAVRPTRTSRPTHHRRGGAISIIVRTKQASEVEFAVDSDHELRRIEVWNSYAFGKRDERPQREER